MEIVGSHLRDVALNGLTGEPAADLYARSAYNRYYYAAFLKVRELLGSLDNRWSGLPHKSYPELLRGQISKKLKEGNNKARRVGDSQLGKTISIALSACKNLATLMETGKAVRVVADYEPHIKILFSGTDRFSLNKIEISEAHNWPHKAEIWTHSIIKAWEQIDD